MVLRKSFYIHWSVGRSPRVHEVNPGRDLSRIISTILKQANLPLLLILPRSIMPMPLSRTGNSGELGLSHVELNLARFFFFL